MAFWENTCVFCEIFSMDSLLNQSWTYQGNPCGVYPDLSSISRSGVIQTLWPVPSDPLLIRITSSGIRASALDTSSMLFNIFFLHNLSQVHVCSIICVLVVCISVCVVIFVPVIVFVFVPIFVRFCFWSCPRFRSRSCSYFRSWCRWSVCALLNSNSILFYSNSVWDNSACWMNLGFRSNCLISYLPIERIHWLD